VNASARREEQQRVVVWPPHRHSVGSGRRALVALAVIVVCSWRCVLGLEVGGEGVEYNGDDQIDNEVAAAKQHGHKVRRGDVAAGGGHDGLHRARPLTSHDGEDGQHRGHERVKVQAWRVGRVAEAARKELHADERTDEHEQQQQNEQRDHLLRCE
jgi:hypothetical protein